MRKHLISLSTSDHGGCLICHSTAESCQVQARYQKLMKRRRFSPQDSPGACRQEALVIALLHSTRTAIRRETQVYAASRTRLDATAVARTAHH